MGDRKNECVDRKERDSKTLTIRFALVQQQKTKLAVATVKPTQVIEHCTKRRESQTKNNKQLKLEIKKAQIVYSFFE